MAQLGATLVFGSIGLILFLFQYEASFVNDNLHLIIIPTIVILSVVIFVLIRSKIEFKGFSIKRIISFIVAMPIKIHFRTLLYAVVRYFIFSFQFYYLLLILGVNLGYLNTMIIITTVYLLSSVIPVVNTLDVIVKGSVALYLFSFSGVNELTVLYATTVMWILNMVLPSLPGSLYVLKYDHGKAITTHFSTE